MRRILRLALVAPTLALAHQLVFLARYGSIYGEALAHSGHGAAWSDAVATVAIGAAVLVLASVVGLLRLTHEIRGAMGRPRVSTELARSHASRRPVPGTPLRRDLLALVAGIVRSAAWLTVLTVAALTIQENLEHAAAGLDAPGIGILVSRDYPFALAIVVGASIAVASVSTLLTWRRAVLVARLRALSARSFVPRRATASRRPRLQRRAPRVGPLARQLGRRAPPLVLPA